MFKAGDFCKSSDKVGKILSVEEGEGFVNVLIYKDGDPTDLSDKIAITELEIIEPIKPQRTVHKSAFKFELKGVKEDEQFGYFEGYASVFNVVDSDADVVQPGAFAETLASGRKVKMCWQHSFYDVIGGFTEMKEDANGLYVKGRINLGVEKGREAYALLKAGDIDSMSIGYSCEDREYRDGIRLLKKLKLYEVSLVTEPANTSAVVTSVKFDQIKDLSAIEALLMSKGFTSTDAKSLISKVKEISLKSDAEEEKVPEVQSSVDAGVDDMAMLAVFTQLKSITHKIRNS